MKPVDHNRDRVEAAIERGRSASHAERADIVEELGRLLESELEGERDQAGQA